MEENNEEIMKTDEAGAKVKDLLAVELGRRGGIARAKKLSPEKRSAIARHAALTRFGKNTEQVEVSELEIILED